MNQTHSLFNLLGLMHEDYDAECTEGSAGKSKLCLGGHDDVRGGGVRCSTVQYSTAQIWCLPEYSKGLGGKGQQRTAKDSKEQ